MAISHKKAYGVYHWDTFDNETFLVHDADTLDTAREWTRKHYGDRIRRTGADRVDIVDRRGNIVEHYSVG